MMNYQIIKDEKLLRDFIEWLPELKPTEKYYLCLFSRSKYCKDENGINTMPHIKSDKSQLKRLVTDKKRMYDKIKQLECEIGAYKHNELPVPQKALALYITVNPREMWKATINSMVKLANCIRDNNILVNPHQEVLSEIQRTKGKTTYVTFDIDYKQGDHIVFLKDWTRDRVGYSNNHRIIETRGGYHILIHVDSVEKEFKNTWFNAIAANQYLDQGVDKDGKPVENMIPVVGCTQGDFTPYFINF